MKRKTRTSLIICAVMAVVTILLMFLPDVHLNPFSRIPREQVRIETVDNSALMPLGIVYSGVQACEVTVLTGAHRGQTGTGSNYLNSALDKDKLYVAGDIAYAMVQGESDSLQVTLIDHYRAGRSFGYSARLPSR